MTRARGASAWSFAAISQMLFHPVVYEKDLAAAFEFLLDGRLDKLLVPTGNNGLYGDAVLGRRFDHAHVPKSNQRHVERARDRRRGQ